MKRFTQEKLPTVAAFFWKHAEKFRPPCMTCATSSYLTYLQRVHLERVGPLTLLRAINLPITSLLQCHYYYDRPASEVIPRFIEYVGVRRSN